MVLAAFLLSAGKFRRRQSVLPSQRRTDQDRSGPLHPSELFLLPGGRAEFLWPYRAEARSREFDGSEQQSLAPCRHRETLRARPGIGEGAEPGTIEGRRREADLSHRSLSRQRNRTEHHGV